MKVVKKNLFYTIIFFYCIIFNNNTLFAQIIIESTDLPTAIGSLFINEDDTVENVEVNVGLSGENQVWRFDQEYPAIFTRQQIVEADSAPFHNDYPDANIVTHFYGELGNLIHTYNFDEVYGDIYSYQKITENSLTIQGVGVDSAIFEFNDFNLNFDGSLDFQPDLLVYNLPLKYKDSLTTVSSFTAEVDTTIFLLPVKLVADIKDSVMSVVDGWGTLILPDSSYECLRIKSHIHLNEDIYLNGELSPFSRKSRTINYTWVAKKYGVVAKIISHTNFSDPDLNDNFTLAKQVSRLHLFNPKFELSTVDTSGEPGDSITLPIFVSNVTDLNITSIKTNICFDSNILTPINIITQGTLSEIWENIEYTVSDTGLALSLKGETALSGQGVLCYIQFIANPNSENNDSTEILFKDISILEKGPKVQSKQGNFYIKTQTHVKNDLSSRNKKFVLHSNYPNPFNAGTSISYQLFSTCHVNLQIYNSLGQLIQVIINKNQQSGDYNIHWDGRNFENMDVPSGLYFYIMSIQSNDNDYKIVRKMILLR